MLMTPDFKSVSFNCTSSTRTNRVPNNGRRCCYSPSADGRWTDGLAHAASSPTCLHYKYMRHNLPATRCLQDSDLSKSVS